VSSRITKVPSHLTSSFTVTELVSSRESKFLIAKLASSMQLLQISMIKRKKSSPKSQLLWLTSASLNVSLCLTNVVA